MGKDTFAHGLIEPTAKKRIHYDDVLVERRHAELVVHHLHTDTQVLQAQEIDSTVSREPVLGVYEPHLYCTACNGKHTRNGKAVATVVAWPREDRKAATGIALKYCIGEHTRRTLHQVNGGNWLMLYGVGIKLLYSGCVEEFHNCDR